METESSPATGEASSLTSGKAIQFCLTLQTPRKEHKPMLKSPYHLAEAKIQGSGSKKNTPPKPFDKSCYIHENKPTASRAADTCCCWLSAFWRIRFRLTD